MSTRTRVDVALLVVGLLLLFVGVAVVMRTPDANWPVSPPPLQPIPSTPTTHSWPREGRCGTDPAGRGCPDDPCPETGQVPGAPWGMCNPSTTPTTTTPTFPPELMCEAIHPTPPNCPTKGQVI